MIIIFNKFKNIGNSLTAWVFSNSPQFQVLWTIVGTNSIAMVDSLIIFKGSPKNFFHYQSMFKCYRSVFSATLWNIENPISMMGNISTLKTWAIFSNFINSFTIIRAVMIFGAKYNFRSFPFLFFAIHAFNKCSSFLTTFLRTARCAFMRVKKIFPAEIANAAINSSEAISFAYIVYDLLKRHILSPLKRMGRAVVHEAEASQHAPKRESLGFFVNIYSIA